jgi:PIN domain
MAKDEKAPFQRNVFLDTEVFKTNNFNFDSQPLKLLKNLVSEDRACVFITDIVEREVRSRMKRELTNSQDWFKKLDQEARILLSAPSGALYKHPKKLDVTALYESMDTAFTSFLETAKVEVLDCSGVSIEEILEAYFDVQPPFGHREEKRKEFPDAISMAAVANRFRKSGAYVISRDEDLCKACDGHKHLSHLPRIEDFLKAEAADHEDVSWIVTALHDKNDELRRAMVASFDDVYFYLNDQEGQVNKIEVDGVVLGDAELIQASQFEATIQMICKVRFTANITYDDPGLTVFSEGERLSFGTIDEQVEREQREPFLIFLKLDRVNKAIDELHCGSADSVGIPAVDPNNTVVMDDGSLYRKKYH